MVGLSKKILIADSIAIYVSPIYANALKTIPWIYGRRAMIEVG
jgi:hypothetical protein